MSLVKKRRGNDVKDCVKNLPCFFFQVFQRERLNGHYGVVAFVMGNTLSSMPFLFLIATVSSSICYFMVGLHPGFVHFVYFTLGLYSCVLVVEGMMMAIASVVPNFLMGIITGAGIQVSYPTISSERKA